MRILKVLPGITPDAGTERSFLATAPELIAHGADLHLALLTERQTLVPELERLGVVVHDLSSDRHLASRVRSLVRLIRALSPDLVHASLFEATLPAQIACARTEVPILVSWVNTNYGDERTVEPGSSSWKLRWYQYVETIAGRISHCSYHAVTAGVGRSNAAALGVDSARVFIGERGRDPIAFSRRQDPIPGIATGWPRDNSRLVLAVGRQEPQKGYESLLEAFDELVDSHPETRLLIAGRVGLSTPGIDEVHARMRHGERVHFLGQRDDIAELMSVADVVVCASWREGAAGALIEAMACGTPVVSVPLAGMEGVLHDGVDAVVVERTRLAHGIAAVLDDAEFAQRLSIAGRKNFEDRFTIAASAARLLDIYRVASGA